MPLITFKNHLNSNNPTQYSLKKSIKTCEFIHLLYFRLKLIHERLILFNLNTYNSRSLDDDVVLLLLMCLYYCGLLRLLLEYLGLFKHK